MPRRIPVDAACRTDYVMEIHILYILTPRSTTISTTSFEHTTNSRFTLPLNAPPPFLLASGFHGPSSANPRFRHKENDTALGAETATVAEGGAGAAGGGEEAEGEPVAASIPTKFTLTAGECLRVRELFAWLVEPCLAFLRREVSEMVRESTILRPFFEITYNILGRHYYPVVAVSGRPCDSSLRG